MYVISFVATSAFTIIVCGFDDVLKFLIVMTGYTDVVANSAAEDVGTIRL